MGIKEFIQEEIVFLEDWLETYSEGEFRMLVSEREIFDRIKYLKVVINSLLNEQTKNNTFK